VLLRHDQVSDRTRQRGVFSQAALFFTVSALRTFPARQARRVPLKPRRVAFAKMRLSLFEKQDRISVPGPRSLVFASGFWFFFLGFFFLLLFLGSLFFFFFFFFVCLGCPGTSCLVPGLFFSNPPEILRVCQSDPFQSSKRTALVVSTVPP